MAPWGRTRSPARPSSVFQGPPCPLKDLSELGRCHAGEGGGGAYQAGHSRAALYHGDRSEKGYSTIPPGGLLWEAPAEATPQALGPRVV